MELWSIHFPISSKNILPSFVDNTWKSEQRLDFTSYIYWLSGLRNEDAVEIWKSNKMFILIDMSLTNGLTNEISLSMAEKAENFDWLRLNILSQFQISTACSCLIHLLIHWASQTHIYQLVFFLLLFSLTCHFIYSMHRNQNNKTLSHELQLNDNNVSHERTMSLATPTMKTLQSVFNDSVAWSLDNTDRCLVDEWMDGSTSTLEELISFADYLKENGKWFVHSLMTENHLLDSDWKD